MTLGALIEEVLENLGPLPEGQRPQRGEVKRLLNLAQDDVSLKVGVPQAHVSVPTTGVIAGPFQLPLRFRAEGFLRAEIAAGELTSGREVSHLEVPVYSPGVAQSFRARWQDEDYAGAPFLVHAAADGNAGFTPAGIAAASYRFLLQALPEPMTEDGHEPWSVLDYCADPPVRLPGAMPGYHRLLAHHVSYELLQRVGNERWQAFYDRYRDMELQLFSAITPISVYLPGRRLGGE